MQPIDYSLGSQETLWLRNDRNGSHQQSMRIAGRFAKWADRLNYTRGRQRQSVGAYRGVGIVIGDR